MKTYTNIDDETKHELNDEVSPAVAQAILCDPMSGLITELDIRTTIASLPSTEKAICILLRQGERACRICRILKITTDAFWNKFMPAIRRRFIEYGFEPHEINL